MKVVVLYNDPDGDPDDRSATEDRDVLVQRDAVLSALARLGHLGVDLGCTLNLDAVRNRLSELQPNVVFNLVESLGGTDRLMVLPTMLLDALEIRYTGASTEAILSSSNKLTAKRRLADEGLPTAAWFETSENGIVGSKFALEAFARDGNSTWILKPILEHASFGIDDSSLVTVHDELELEDQLRERQQQVGRPLFAEQFIEGREFNLSLLAGRVLPPAEIDFSTFPAEKPCIVGHPAKWDEDSFEYKETPRRFDFPPADSQLLEGLSELARSCWQLFELKGWARVDFRVDSRGRPWILEVNANPCLSPDAGFAAALSVAEIAFEDAVQEILEDAAAPVTRSIKTLSHSVLNS